MNDGVTVFFLNITILCVFGLFSSTPFSLFAVKMMMTVMMAIKVMMMMMIMIMTIMMIIMTL